MRNDDGTVTVGMDEVVMAHDHAMDADGRAEIDAFDMSMRGHDRAGEHAQALGHGIEVAHAAIGHRADTAERLMEMGLHLAPKRADSKIRPTALLQAAEDRLT